MNSAVCLTCFYLGFTHCNPPLDQLVPGSWGSTYILNNYCVDNPNLYDVLTIQYVLGYISFGLYVCLVLIGDTKSGAA